MAGINHAKGGQVIRYIVCRYLFNVIDKELGKLTALVNNATILMPQTKVVAAVAWLISDESSYTTESFTEVSGGR